MKIEELKDSGDVLYLHSGNREAIKAAQKYLNEYGYTDAYGRKLVEDGVFGKNTFNAVIKYQKENGLEEDGKIGDETWSHMWSNKGGPGNTSEHNRYAERKTGATSHKESKINVPDLFGSLMRYAGTKMDIPESNIYSPDGYVEQVENENALRNREEPITGVQDPYDMASYAQNYSDTMEWLYQKNRLSK